MDMSGSHRIEASRDAVWAALNDPEILRQCIPGCEEVVRQSDTEMTAKVVAKVGPVSAKFAGKVTLSDLDPPNGYTITGEGSGGAAGFGKGGATVTLADDGGATLLSYTAKAQVGARWRRRSSPASPGSSVRHLWRQPRRWNRWRAKRPPPPPRPSQPPSLPPPGLRSIQSPRLSPPPAWRNRRRRSRCRCRSAVARGAEPAISTCRGRHFLWLWFCLRRLPG